MINSKVHYHAAGRHERSGARSILMLEARPESLRVLRFVIEREGFSCQAVHAGERLHARLAESPAAIIVERGQWISLEAVMAAVRSVEGRAPIPVLVIGSAERASERFEAFEHGAVDFLAQPIDSLEVLWRLKAHLRLVQDDTQTIQVGDLCLDWRNHVVTVAGRTVSITPNECAILRHLLAQPGRAFDVESLLVGALQYPPQLGNPEIVRTHIRNLRSKVDREGARRILNIPRVGYVFEPQQACLNG